jgi:CRP-like cAMP-binding protein
VRCIYLLCDGRAKLSICSDSGKRLTLRIAGPGEGSGWGCAVHTPYEITAELPDTSQIVFFIRRKELMKFLRERPAICMQVLQVVRMLSQDLHGAYERLRSIGTVRSRRPRTIIRPRVLYA